MPPIRISRSRMTSCPACHAHIRVADRLQETDCPFCGARLEDAVRSARQGTLTLLRRSVNSRSGTLAASLLSLSLSTAACSDDTSGEGVDAGIVDAATGDGTVADSSGDSSGTGDTSGAGDTGPADVAVDTAADTGGGGGALYGLPADVLDPDTGATDAGTTDAGTTDAGTTDAGTTDAGTTDAGTPDAGTPDAGVDDTNANDTKPAKDIPISPLYGIPAPDTLQQPDSGDTTDSGDSIDAEDAPDSAPQPEYGIPPGD